MKVLMMTTSAGPDGARHAGTEVEVGEEEGQALLAGGHAALVTGQVAKEDEESPKAKPAAKGNKSAPADK